MAKSEHTEHCYEYCLVLNQLVRYLDPESFVNAIAPTGDLSRIGRAQFGILFKVADASRRGLVSWDDFTVFETLLKRPDADYWMAFEYFDVLVFPLGLASLCSNVTLWRRDHSGFISYDEFKNVFSANIGPNAIPFDFDWYVHVLPILSPHANLALTATGLNYISEKRTAHMC